MSFFNLSNSTPSRLKAVGSFFLRGSISIGLLLMGTASFAQETLQGDHVRIRWLAPDAFAAHEHSAHLALYFEVDEHWHVYWRNPGDSGTAPKINLSSDNARFNDILWPFPARLPVEHLTNLGYEGNVAYPFLTHISPGPGASELTIAAELEWLVCKIECIPGFGSITLTRPLIDTDEDHWQPTEQNLLNHFLNRVPEAASASPWHASPALYDKLQHTLTLSIQATEGSGSPSSKKPDAFPLNGEFVNAGGPEITPLPEGFELRFKTNAGAATPQSTEFVVSDGSQAWYSAPVAIHSQSASPSPAGLPQDGQQPLLLLFVLALAGGVILNLMPCVFPVLSIKVFGLLQTHQQDSATRLREAVAYGAGVLLTFAALGALFLALRSAGAAVGWGFQLQSPWVVLGLAILFWLMGLGFLGAFAMGQRLMGLAASAGTGSSFSTGVLAVFVAAPCTGPFMGAALGASATLPTFAAMSIFIGLGAGLALPFVLLATVPALARALPKPGAWMERLKEFFAFPLFATALWLLWVFNQLGGKDTWLTGATTLLGLTLAIWLYRSPGRTVRIAAVLIAAGSLVWAGMHIQNAKSEQHLPANTVQWFPFDQKRITTANAAGQAVFVDFTAAWCITCQVNKKLVLETEAVEALFAEHNVLLIRADWTRYDPAITEALASYNRSSVPLYIYYHPDGAITRLPEILRAEMISDLFRTTP